MPRPQTLAEALEQWLQVKTAGRGLSPHTLRAYRTDIATLAAHLLRVADPGFVDDRRGADYVLVEDLSPDALTKALSSIEQAGAADKSRSRLIGTLRGLIAFLILRGVLAVDPLTATGIERPKAAERLPRYVEGDAEFARVIAAAARPADNARRPWPERDLALAVLLAATGARAAEVCGLRIEDLVLDRRRAVCAGGRQGQRGPGLLPSRPGAKTSSLAAVAAQHDDVLLRLHREPTCRLQFGNQQNLTALDALHDRRVLEHDIINTFPRWNGTKWLYPRSRLMKDELRPVLLPLVGDDESYIQLYNRTEYRIALAQALSSEPGRFRSAPGEFIGEWQWGQDDTLIWETDFPRTPIGPRGAGSHRTTTRPTPSTRSWTTCPPS